MTLGLLLAGCSGTGTTVDAIDLSVPGAGDMEGGTLVSGNGAGLTPADPDAELGIAPPPLGAGVGVSGMKWLPSGGRGGGVGGAMGVGIGTITEEAGDGDGAGALSGEGAGLDDGSGSGVVVVGGGAVDPADTAENFGVCAGGARANGDVDCGCAIVLGSESFWVLAAWFDRNGGKIEGDGTVFPGWVGGGTGGDTPTIVGGGCVFVVLFGISVALMGTIVEDARAFGGFTVFASSIGGSSEDGAFAPVAGAAGVALCLSFPNPSDEGSHCPEPLMTGFVGFGSTARAEGGTPLGLDSSRSNCERDIP